MDDGREKLECSLCACKHLAKACELLNEAKLGYPMAFFTCLANMSLAEDHVVQKYPAQAEAIRVQRKELELVPTYDVPWEALVITTALLEDYDVSKIWPRRGSDEFENRYLEPVGFRT